MGEPEGVAEEGLGDLKLEEPAEMAEKVGAARWKGKEGISPEASGEVRIVLSRPLIPVGLLLENGAFAPEEERSDSEGASFEKVLKRSVLVSEPCMSACSAAALLFISSSVRDLDLL